jgi:nucleotidyltransferase substrate binding protein (TIGR01987 family)
MNEICRQRADFERILGQLRSVLDIPASERTTRDRDSAILRFELTFEVCWKLLQRMVREQGLESNGPRQALERAFSLGWIEDESLWFDLLKDRNFAIHVYKEEWAEDLFGRLFAYRDAFEALLRKLPPGDSSS